MKSFLKGLFVLSFLCVFASSCKINNKGPKVSEIKNQIKSQINFENMIEIQEDDLQMFYINKEDFEDFWIAVNDNGISADELVVVKAKSRKHADNISKQLQKRIQDKINQSENYNPEENFKIKKSVINKNDEYVSYFVHNDYEKIQNLYNKAAHCYK